MKPTNFASDSKGATAPAATYRGPNPGASRRQPKTAFPDDLPSRLFWEVVAEGPNSKQAGTMQPECRYSRA